MVRAHTFDDWPHTHMEASVLCQLQGGTSPPKRDRAIFTPQYQPHEDRFPRKEGMEADKAKPRSLSQNARPEFRALRFARGIEVTSGPFLY